MTSKLHATEYDGADVNIANENSSLNSSSDHLSCLEIQNIVLSEAHLQLPLTSPGQFDKPSAQVSPRDTCVSHEQNTTSLG